MSAATTTGSVPLLSRAELSGLLAMMPAFDGRTASETELRWWREALAGHAAPECQAAILAHSKTSRSITPGDITRRIREARDRSGALARRRNADPVADRARHARAARRGMAEIYAVTGWTRRPDQAAALTVACPVPGCAAAPGVICAPVNQPEPRDQATRVHISRLTQGRRVAGEANA